MSQFLPQFLPQFLLIASAHFLALISPGQDFFLLIRTTLRHGFKHGLFASTGIALANAIWIVIALCGVEILRSQPLLFLLLQIIGGIWLAVMGCVFLRAKPHDLTAQNAPASHHNAFYLGLVSGLSNPKNGLFYAGLFSLGVAPNTSNGILIFYGIWMSSIVWLWDILIAAWIGHPTWQRRLSHWQWKIERLAGWALIALSVGLFVELVKTNSL